MLVKFQIEHLCQQTTAKQILVALDGFKCASTGKGPLGPTYDIIIKRIRSQPKSCADLALKVISCLVKARQTLTIDEIRIATVVQPNRYELNALDLPDRATVLDVCAGLATVDEASNTIRLAHYTIQEYPLDNSIIPKDADLGLAMTCTTFLSFKTFAVGAYIARKSLRDRLKAYPFLRYAASQLSYHLQRCSEDLSIDMVLQFLQSSGNISSYLQALYLWEYRGHLFDDSMCTKDLQIASIIGHCAAVERLLDKGSDISA